MKKKLSALFLALILLLQAPVCALADITDTPPESGEVVVSGEASSEINQPSVIENQEETPQLTEVVNFEAQLQIDFPFKKNLNEKKGMFLVTLHPKTTDAAQNPEAAEGEEVPVDAGTENHYDTVASVEGNVITFRAANVPAGDYTLKMDAQYYFENFAQDVTIHEGAKTTLIFSNSYASSRGDGKTSPGVFALGDVNNDRVINHDDVVAMLPYMGQTDTRFEDGDEEPNEVYDDTFDAVYDLNLDGRTDIEDLSILAYNMDHTEDHYATPIITVLQSAVKVEKEQVKAVPQGERKLDTIMEDAEEPIQLAPEKDEAISEENPVEIEMQLASTTEIGGMVISAPADNGPTAGTIKVETVNPDNPNGEGVLMEVPITDEAAPQRKIRKAVRALADDISSSGAKAIRKADGSIEINLGRQVAIKKVTIVVTATAASTNLTEIAKVEFLNDMESRIPEPELNIPGNIQVSGKGDNFTVTWDAETNVTAYEVAVSAVSKEGKDLPEQTYKAGVNRIVINDFKGGVKDKVTPLYTYFIRIKSVNGKWSSPYSVTVDHYQKAGAAPDAPDYVSVNGKYRQLDVSWKDMPGTEQYSLEYRVKNSGAAYTVVSNILTNSYKITGLKDDTTYEIRVRGWNTDDNGNLRHGGYSVPAIGKTTTQVPEFSKYGMIPSSDIVSITTRGSDDPSKHEEGYPNGATKFDPNWLIDGDYTTFFYCTHWAGAGPVVTFNEEKVIKEVIISNRLEDGYYTSDWPGYQAVYITATDESGKSVNVGCSVQGMNPSAKNTTRFVLNQPVKAKTLYIGLHRYYNADVSMSEVNFFGYNSLEDEIYALYADAMHVTLAEGVTQAKIDELRERVSAPDPNYEEYYHPKKDLLLSELEYAEKLLNGAGIEAPVVVNPNITTQNTGPSQFNGGLSGYQPLGYVAGANQTITVFAGQKGKQIGQVTDARLVYTQYHAEAAVWRSGEIQLKQGANEITLNDLVSIDAEHGGSLYVVQTSDNVKNNPVQIRISGATKIPTLDLYRAIGNDRASIDETAWKAAIKAYIEELIKYTDNLQANHAKHKEVTGDYDYDIKNCFLNATEISLDNVLISVPASQILNGLGGKGKDVDYLTNKLYNSAVAMNQMIELFYKERGLNPGAINGYNGIPSARFNIRYHRMFAGAFMYAGGNHLGIEWSSVTGLCAGNPVVTDANGKRIGGSMFGWGIAHEMGHNADVGGLTYAEVTNNIWAQFEKTKDTEGSSRIPYPAVYKHVASNASGKPGNVFAQLGMYWQLHLAYDKNYANYDYYKADQTAAPEAEKDFAYANYINMCDNEFFARYYRYKRNPALAPTNNGGMTLANAFKGSLTTDQIIMRVSCAAAQRDLTDFFKAWGIVVDATTASYASQFPKEERKLQYINDAAHEYTLAGKAAMTSDTVDVTLKQGVKQDARKVTLTISLPNETNMDAILGYEILRNGEPVAFIPPATVTVDENGNTVSKYADTTVYTDLVETLNNRVMTYSVVAYDKYLNATSATELEPIKIRHEGDLPKDNWTVASTNVTSTEGMLTVYEGTEPIVGNEYTDVTTNQTVTYNEQMDVRYLDENTGEVLRTDSAAKRIFDGDKDTYFKGNSSSGNAQLVISLGGKQQIVGFAVEPPKTSNVKEWTQLWKYTIELSTDGGITYSRPTNVVKGNTRLDDGREVLYLRLGNNVQAWSATHVRIITQNSLLALEEFSLLGPSGDNVDIGISTVDEVTGVETWDTNSAIGILENDYVLDASSESIIPAGSFIVTGKYAGNAAYNVVKLYNQNHKMYDDSFENKRDSIINGYQVFFADMPDLGHIVNVKDGTWIYWLEPLSGENEGKYGLPGAGEDGADIVVELPTSVYAELYRVDNAMTLAGERLVSDSFVVKVPETLPSITLNSAS